MRFESTWCEPSVALCVCASQSSPQFSTKKAGWDLHTSVLFPRICLISLTYGRWSTAERKRDGDADRPPPLLPLSSPPPLLLHLSSPSPPLSLSRSRLAVKAISSAGTWSEQCAGLLSQVHTPLPVCLSVLIFPFTTRLVAVNFLGAPSCQQHPPPPPPPLPEHTGCPPTSVLP